MCFDAILANTLRHLLYTPNTLQNSQSPHRQHFEQLVSHRSRRFKSIWDLGTPGICGHNTGIWGLGSGISGIRRAPGREMGFAGSEPAVPVQGIMCSRKISILWHKGWLLGSLGRWTWENSRMVHGVALTGVTSEENDNQSASKSLDIFVFSPNVNTFFNADQQEP